MATLRHKFLPRDEIGYFRQNVSAPLQDSIRWLSFLMYIKDNEIQHARNGGQIRCGLILVTGFDEKNQTVYEFNDCVLDGCPKCSKNGERAYETKMKKLDMLRAQNLEVIDIWTCAFRDICSGNPLYRKFMKEVPVDWYEPLNVRHAFYGGRTNASVLHYECLADERIDYVDFTSLYPYINKYGQYPIGHPDILIAPSLQLLLDRTYFGVVKCRIIPPRGLFHPVLPVRYGGKLMFPLCRSCVDQKLCDCTHEGLDRAFEGTWCTPELYVAMDHGYVVDAIQEVHHFKQLKVGLFADYVNTFLKSKQEASGWPLVCYNAIFRSFVKKYVLCVCFKLGKYV